LDSRERAVQAWQEAGEPQTELGSMGQERRHHLAVALERAESALANLAGKVERSAARRVSRRPSLPSGAVVVRRDGSYVEILVDGRLMVRSVRSGEWMLAIPEEEYEQGTLLRWLDADGVPQFADPPPSRVRSGLPSRAEALKWARARGIPEQAVIDWLANPDARSKIVLAKGVDLATFGAVGVV
jgi:hypothetical protein